MVSIGDTGRARPRSSDSGLNWPRLIERLGGALFLAAALFAALALATHDGRDPSWDHAVDAPARNLMGLAGSQLADALLQAFGAHPRWRR